MTEQQQREACAELARRMGWTLVHHGYGVSPDEFTQPQPRAIPDYFNDPAASRELVAWLAATVLIINWQRLEGDEQWDTPEPAIQRFHFHHDDA